MESYRYDAEGTRIYQESKTGGNLTWQHFDYFPHYTVGITATQAITKTYFFGGRPVAQRVGGRPLTYLHADHLGSTVLTTGVTGSQKYHAYGATRSGLVKTEHQFTGHETDSTGLIYMQARYYDPVIGQFISPDTIVPDPNNLYAYNRYMYAYGNPLKYNDPNGHEPHDDQMHPCDWTTCVLINGEQVPISEWTSDIHRLYYPPAPAAIGEAELKQAAAVGIDKLLLPSSGAEAYGIMASAGMGVDFTGNVGMYLDEHGNTFVGTSLGIGGNTGINADIAFFQNIMPGASSVDTYRGETVNVGLSAAPVAGPGGTVELNITNDSATNDVVLGVTGAVGVSAKFNLPALPVELYANVSHTWQSPIRWNIFDALGLPRPEK